MKDSGAIANGFVENKLTMELRDLIAEHIDVIKDDDYKTLSQIIQELDTRTRYNDIICDLHFNASDNEKATGCEVFYPNKYNTLESKLANELSQIISSTLDIPNRGVKKESESARGKLAMMSPMGINVLIEVCFITNKRDMSQYEMFKETLAEKIGDVLSRYASS